MTTNRRADELKPGDKIARGLRGETVKDVRPSAHLTVLTDVGEFTVMPDFEFAIEEPHKFEAGDIVVRKPGCGGDGSKAVLLSRRPSRYPDAEAWDVIVIEEHGQLFAHKGDTSHWGERFFEVVA